MLSRIPGFRVPAGSGTFLRDVHERCIWRIAKISDQRGLAGGASGITCLFAVSRGGLMTFPLINRWQPAPRTVQEACRGLIAKLTALRAGTAPGAARQTGKQEEIAEIKVILQEIKVYIERNQRSKKVVQADLERLMAQMQREIEAIMSMLDTVSRTNATLDGGTQQGREAGRKRMPSFRDRKLEVMIQVGNLLDAAILLQRPGKPGAKPQQKPGAKPGPPSPAGGSSSGKSSTDEVYSILAEAQRRLQTI
jgi:hypothetical protein